jgi:hypothetical protein
MTLTKKHKIMIGSVLALIVGIFLFKKKSTTDKALTGNTGTPNAPSAAPSASTPSATPVATPSGKEVIYEKPPFVLNADRIFPKQGITSIACFNDKELKQAHYRAIPIDDNPQWYLYSAYANSFQDDVNKFKTHKTEKGEYSVAISAFEYVYVGDGAFADIFVHRINHGEPFEISEDGEGVTIPIKGSARAEDGRVLYKKVVWVNAKDLVLTPTP